MAVSRRPFDGYPTSFGNIRTSIFPVFGPVSYAQYTAPTTGGQDVVVNGLSGVKIADKVISGVSRSGLYRAEVVQYEAANVNGVSVARAQIVLKWYVVATGSEVGAAVDLSAEVIDMMIFGPK